MERTRPGQLTPFSNYIDILLEGEVLVGKLRKAIPPDGGLYDPDKIQVFRQLGIQISDVASSLYMIVDELN